MEQPQLVTQYDHHQQHHDFQQEYSIPAILLQRDFFGCFGIQLLLQVGPNKMVPTLPYLKGQNIKTGTQIKQGK